MKKQSRTSRVLNPFNALTTNLTKLADDSVAFAKVTPEGYTPKASKKGATHKIVETPRSVIAAPLKKWPTPPPVEQRYGAPRMADVPAESTPEDTWHPAIPLDATWLEYRAGSSSIMMPITDLPMLRGFRGTIRFGRLRYGEDFVSMMPGEEGAVTKWSDGETVFAEGRSPADIKAHKAEMKVAANRSKLVYSGPGDAPNTPAGTIPGKKSPTVATDKPARVARVSKPKAGSVVQNGQTRPGSGGKTARVWDIADSLSKIKDGAVSVAATKEAVIAQAVKDKLNPAMAATQFARWRRFNGVAK